MKATKDQSDIMHLNIPKKSMHRIFVGLFVGIMVLLCCFHLPMAAYAALEGQGSGLVAWWKFDEGSGTITYDSSGNNNHGIIRGSPSWTSGISGGALSLNGTSNFVYIPYSESLRLGIKTIAVWVNTSDFLKSTSAFYGWGRGSGCADNYQGYYLPNGSIGATYQNTAGATVRPYGGRAPNNTVKLGEWAHYVFKYDTAPNNPTISVFKNGVKQATPYSGSDGLSDACAMTAIGSQEGMPNPNYVRTFAGIMDDFRVYNRVLSDSEIAELYNKNRPISSDTTPPSTPIGLTATAISASQINLSWNASIDNIGVVGYIIYRGGSKIAVVRAGTTYSDLAHTISSTYSYTIAPSTSYTYNVSAYDGAYNVSLQSSPASVTTPASPGGIFNVSVTMTGTNINTVQSSPSGISCSSGTCNYAFPVGSTVHLSPYPFILGMADSTPPFMGWTGSGCSGTGECFLYMDSDKAVTAEYGNPPPRPSPPVNLRIIVE